MSRAVADREMDPALKQLHLYICMMIELKDYALTDKSKALFVLCRNALLKKVANFPAAQNVVNMYCAVEGPHSMPAHLQENQYPAEYVDQINKLMTVIFHEEDPDQFIGTFNRLTDLTPEN